MKRSSSSSRTAERSGGNEPSEHGLEGEECRVGTEPDPEATEASLSKTLDSNLELLLDQNGVESFSQTEESLDRKLQSARTTESTGDPGFLG